MSTNENVLKNQHHFLMYELEHGKVHCLLMLGLLELVNSNLQRNISIPNPRPTAWSVHLEAKSEQVVVRQGVRKITKLHFTQNVLILDFCIGNILKALSTEEQHQLHVKRSTMCRQALDLQAVSNPESQRSFTCLSNCYIPDLCRGTYRICGWESYSLSQILSCYHGAAA